MRINYNVSSLIAKNALNNNDTRLSASIKKLSSGYKINSAKDNAASLAIARKMNAQIKSLNRANQNANDGVSVVNTADGAMAEMHDILQRMNELSIQAANGTNSDSDRLQIQKEIDQLVAEVDRIADTTQFNSQNLLDGTFAYKGYSNSENIRVKSYSDGVVSGTYAMEKIEYYYYDEYTTYNGSDGSGEHTERFAVESVDKIKDWLIMQDEIDKTPTDYDDISGIKGFPDDIQVEIDGEDIIIKGKDDFELKLTMKALDEKSLDGTTVETETTPDIEIYRYKDLPVTFSVNGTTYSCSISDITTEYDVTSSTYDVYEKSSLDSFSGLKEDLKKAGLDVQSVTAVTYDATNGGFVAMVELKGNPTPQKISMQVPNANGNIEDYAYSKTIATKTKYTVGKGDWTTDGDKERLQFNLTGKGAMRIQVGPSEGQVIAVEIPALNAIYLGIDNFDLTTEDKATEAINIVSNAINQLSSIRAKIGAYTNRLERTITNLDTSEENMTAAYSRIMDVDMADEMIEYTTMQVLTQSSTAMLAQANERPQQVLQLIQ